MNDLQIFNNDQFGEIRTILKNVEKNSWSGFCYLIKFENGLVKIGRTINPYQRFITVNSSYA